MGEGGGEDGRVRSCERRRNLAASKYRYPLAEGCPPDPRCGRSLLRQIPTLSRKLPSITWQILYHDKVLRGSISWTVANQPFMRIGMMYEQGD